MQVLLGVAGVVILAAIAIDVIWTTIGTHGGGPLSRHVMGGLWGAAMRLHRRGSGRSHMIFSFSGPVILLVVIGFWTVATAGGWMLLFAATPHGLVDSDTNRAADLSGRMFFVAYSMSTMGNGDFQPVTPWLRFVTAIMTLSGIGFVTLAVTFILSVLSAVVEMRTLAAMITDMGGTPERIIARSWDGERFEGLDSYLVQLTGMLHLFIEQHLAYPVLRYFHSEKTRTAAVLRLNTLHATLLLIAGGAADHVRPRTMITAPLLDAFEGLAQVFRDERVANQDVSPPVIDLDVLRGIGVPTVSGDDFRAFIARTGDTRRALYSALLNDGWTEEDTRAAR